MRFGRWLVVVAGVVALAWLAWYSFWPEPGAHVLESDGAYVLVGDDDGSSMAGVGLEGTVSMVGGCLGLGGPGVGESVLIWPPGTNIVSDNPLTVRVPNAGSVQVGDPLPDGGGDQLTVSQLPDGIELPSTCPSEQVYVYFPNG